MRLLNVGCGGQRPQDDHWWNLDNLRTQLKEGTPERANLDKEPRYIEADLLTGHLPFADESLDGILLQHVIEHFTCHEAVEALVKCRRILKPRGLLLASVPDAGYFVTTYPRDIKENAIELFSEPIHDPGFEKFFDYALFRFDHKQILTADSMVCLFWRAGFNTRPIDQIRSHSVNGGKLAGNPVYDEMEKQLTRRKFSIEMCAIK